MGVPNDKKMQRFGELLKNERKRSGKKLRDVSAFSGLSVSYISDIEQGRKGPPEIEVVRKFERLFETEKDLLVSAAESERGMMPTQVLSRLQERPILREFFFRIENEPDETLERWLEEKMREET